MSAPIDCCNPPRCPVVPPVNVPGSAGADAFTFTTAAFTIPTVGSDVVVQVLNTAGLVDGQDVLVTGPANFSVVQINGPTTVTLAFIGLPGDSATGTVIQPGASVVPTGQAGAAGAAGLNGYATVTSGFTVPSIGNTVNVSVDNSACFVTGEFVIASGPANFSVSAIPSSTQVTLQFLGNAGDVSPGATVATGTTIAAAGSQGANAYTTLTSQITIPSVGSTVTAAVKSTAAMVVGQVVVMPGPATFKVTTINSATSVTLTFLGYFGDLAPGNFIVNGSVVTPSGVQPMAGVPQYATGLSEGSPYSITTATPQPIGVSVTLPVAGMWVIVAYLNIEYSSDYQGFAGTNLLTINAQRSNNSPTVLPGGTSLVYPGSQTQTNKETFQVMAIAPQPYQSTAGDVITVLAGMAQALVAGSLNIVSATIVAIQVG